MSIFRTLPIILSRDSQESFGECRECISNGARVVLIHDSFLFLNEYYPISRSCLVKIFASLFFPSGEYVRGTLFFAKKELHAPRVTSVAMTGVCNVSFQRRVH